jgi:gamma-glutamyltranspeptidase/glutathione hydrolase
MPFGGKLARYVCLLSLIAAMDLDSQTSRQTMRPVVRGTHYAVSSMKPEASQAAERILRAGGNAFDAIVAGQAVLGITDAIDIAENGFPINDRLARALANTKQLRKYPSTMKAFCPGEIWKNPQLARTLRRLVEADRANASRGRHEALRAARDRFYKGDIAREMAEFSENNDGLFRYEDFASYTAKLEKPVSIDYRGYRSAAYIHTSAEAIKLAMADRDKYLGDTDFVKVPWEGLLSKEYAAERRKLIDPKKASRELRAGVETLERPLDYKLAGKGDHEGDTSYIAVVDKARNAVSLTPSLHTAFGTKVVMGELGFSLNCRGDYYSLMPGKPTPWLPASADPRVDAYALAW